MDVRFVTLPEIDLDDSAFEVRKFASSTRLRDSLARFGILDPPWLHKNCCALIVVDGFQRLRWAKEHGAQGAVCRIFPEDCGARELWTRRIEKKIFEREIDLAEKAQIISILLRLFQSDEIPGFFLTGLNVSNRPEVLRKWALLSARGPESLALLASGAVAERAAIEVAGWDKRSMDSVLHLLQALRASASIQVEIVEHIDEIAIRHEKTGADIIETSPAREIMDSKELNHRQKTQALRELLAELRYPRLSSRKKRFRREIESLGLPSGVRIIPPVAFEGNNWKMELSFTGLEELRRIFDSAGSLIESDRLDTIFGAAGRSGRD
jgi:ParB family chromosome partitioning protein